MSQTPAERLAELLTWETESVGSIDLIVDDTFGSSNKPLNPPDYDAIQLIYIETSMGKRQLDMTGIKAGQPAWRSVAYADGTRFAEVHYKRGDVAKQDMVFIKGQFWMEDNNDRINRPLNILLLNVGREPLHEALPSAEHLGQGEVEGRPCEIFLFRQVKWSMPQDHVYYLDRDIGVPVKVEAYLGDAQRSDEQPIWVWTAKEIEAYDGHHLPRVCELVAFTPEGEPLQTNISTIRSVTFDRDHPASTFWPVIERGVQVFDAVKEVTYQEGGPQTNLPAPAGAAATAVPTDGAPIRATPPGGWSAYAPALTLGTVGALLLAAGLAWRFRQRAG